MRKALLILFGAFLTVAAISCGTTATSASQQINDKKIRDLITWIYTGDGASGIFEEAWITEHCTKKMQDKLIGAYDFDLEPGQVGYASWIIGGWGDGEDMSTALAEITSDRKYYYAHLVPTDYSLEYASGRRTIRFKVFVDANGVVKIDDVEWISDFKYDYKNAEE